MYHLSLEYPVLRCTTCLWNTQSSDVPPVSGIPSPQMYHLSLEYPVLRCLTCLWSTQSSDVPPVSGVPSPQMLPPVSGIPSPQKYQLKSHSSGQVPIKFTTSVDVPSRRRVMHCGISRPPVMRAMGAHRPLHIIDLDYNQISELAPEAIQVSTDQLLLSNNRITAVGERAFAGSQIGTLSLRGNRWLVHLNERAFEGLVNLRTLDLSHTSLTSLPTVGLSGLEELLLQETSSLKVFPSVYAFRSLRRAHLTHPHHCCAFQFPQQHEASRLDKQKEVMSQVESDQCYQYFEQQRAVSSNEASFTRTKRSNLDFDQKISDNARTENFFTPTKSIPVTNKPPYENVAEMQNNYIEEQGFWHSPPQPSGLGRSSHFHVIESNQESIIPSSDEEISRDFSANDPQFVSHISEFPVHDDVGGPESFDGSYQIFPSSHPVANTDQYFPEMAFGSWGPIHHFDTQPHNDDKVIIGSTNRLAESGPETILPEDSFFPATDVMPPKFKRDHKSTEFSNWPAADMWEHDQNFFLGGQSQPYLGLGFGNFGTSNDTSKQSALHPAVDGNALLLNSEGHVEEGQVARRHGRTSSDAHFGTFHTDELRDFLVLSCKRKLQYITSSIDKDQAAVQNETLEVFCGRLVHRTRDVDCTPAPNAFNPCEDIMGNQALRMAVWVVVVTAVVGNTAVIVVLGSPRFRMNVSKFLMLNLAVADLMMGLYLLLIAAMDLHTVSQYFNYAIDWQYGAGCKIAGFLTVFSSELSIFSLTVITIERWYAITYAIHLNKRLKLIMACKIMLVGWIYALLMAVLPLLGVSDYSKTSICLPMDASSATAMGYLMALLLVNGIAFVSICGCYMSMYLSIRSHNPANAKSDLTVAKRMALLVFTDFACWAPIAFFGLTAVAGWPLIDVTRAKILLVFFYPLNSCANPYLYAILTKQYRRDFVLLLEKHGLCTEAARRYRSTGVSSLNNTVHHLTFSPGQPHRSSTYTQVTTSEAHKQPRGSYSGPCHNGRPVGSRPSLGMVEHPPFPSVPTSSVRFTAEENAQRSGFQNPASVEVLHAGGKSPDSKKDQAFENSNLQPPRPSADCQLTIESSDLSRSQSPHFVTVSSSQTSTCSSSPEGQTCLFVEPVGEATNTHLSHAQHQAINQSHIPDEKTAFSGVGDVQIPMIDSCDSSIDLRDREGYQKDKLKSGDITQTSEAPLPQHVRDSSGVLRAEELFVRDCGGTNNNVSNPSSNLEASSFIRNNPSSHRRNDFLVTEESFV
ncbi:Leucine-rich repeat [Trinorchestia longiramus]|nr:Leucine-rich repeat [Trinorchestia longiramus]